MRTADVESDGRLAYHSHCQQRTLGLEPYTVTVLESASYDVATSDVECCGMAGSFGYKSEYYELSMEVGERLRDQFTEPDVRDGPSSRRERPVRTSSSRCSRIARNTRWKCSIPSGGMSR